MEPTDLPSKHADTNPELSGRVRGSDHPAANEQLPRSIWQPGVVKRLADYIKHLREVDNQSDKPNVSAVQHSCSRHPERSCNCAPGACADDDGYPSRHIKYAADLYTCPISGVICLNLHCREWCESGVDRSKT